MANLTCMVCGATIPLDKRLESSVIECVHCGNLQSIPQRTSTQKENLINLATEATLRFEFDHAQALYQQVLSLSPTDADIYWRMALCAYGVTYTKNYDGKWMPTINRTSYISIFSNEHYQKAVSYATQHQQQMFAHDAKQIDDAQKKILIIAKNEEPFDVFICYKETDDNDRRTADSLIGVEIYNKLCGMGYKVFFARRTLEDKGGVDYEPYIFSALYTAKIMIVLATRADYLHSPWVKNEWSRYLGMMKGNGEKTLIPAYKNFDVYALPAEISHIEAIDLNNPGFLDLIVENINGRIGKTENFENAEQYTQDIESEIQNTLLRIEYYIQKSEWEQAKKLIAKVMKLDSDNSMVYYYALLAKFNASSLQDIPVPFDATDEYQLAISYCDVDTVKQLKEHNEELRKRILQAKELMLKEERGCFETAQLLLMPMRGFEDVDSYIEKCEQMKSVQETYYRAVDIIDSLSSSIDDYRRAEKLLDKVKDYYKDQGWIRAKLYGAIGDSYYQNGDYKGASLYYWHAQNEDSLHKPYKDWGALIANCKSNINKRLIKRVLLFVCIGALVVLIGAELLKAGALSGVIVAIVIIAWIFIAGRT